MVIKALGLDKDPPTPKASAKMTDPPGPLVRLMVGGIFLIVGPIIVWIFWELYQLKLAGFF
jgi:hypothetical protein